MPTITARIRFTSCFFMDAVKRFVTSFNNWHSRKNDSGQFYEFVEDGLVAIYQNPAALKNALEPLAEQLSMESPQLIEMTKEFLPLFPVEGFWVNIVVSGISPHSFWMLNHNYYRLIHGDINVEETAEGIRIMFPSFDPFAHFIYAVLKQFLEL